jgi:hypothetical protein
MAHKISLTAAIFARIANAGVERKVWPWCSALGAALVGAAR